MADPGRGPRAPALLSVALVVLVVLTACGGAAEPAPPPGPAFGTLVSLAEHAREEADAGVSAGMVELSWRRAQPAAGAFDDAYLRSVRRDIEALRAAGRTVTLGLGLHDAPPWVIAIPGSRFVDQTGEESDEVNLVFDQRLRNIAEHYLARLAAALDLGEVDAVRLTSGGLPEVLYPGGERYWAFDPNAQGGPDRPASMPPNPLPGWRPGEGGVSRQEVRAWADWYVGALVDVVEWQIATLSALGFRHTYQVLTPGVGVGPAAYDAAVRRGLPPGLLGSGAAWRVFYERLPRRDDLVAYVSSVADGSGRNDSCEPGDAAVPLDAPQAATWSATRWVSRLAREYGHPVAGENPGWNQSARLDESYVDLSDDGMLAAALRQARGCGFRSFYWAHDEQLWDGTVPFDAYAERIARGS
ncbi:hypothetical protein [Pseudonocardia asaccharolytica]|uniref:Glycoside hydrolase family 42 N-terminal domain-containing protein n=1 Tax=Pseudonocardia asaccharolytica DSM 44247 = NBRC 16224 TaxID=1123024 RepID=A0A511CXM6_9PSEU|nr:hypothetical protein [Pseudonocardia asaccharolytica]GEL17311.1 hypothetical protein PA7_11480 [Pseudonocardia asaccharolytica DSM 44247 = NBRC 16224]